VAELTILDPRAEIGIAITPYALSFDIARPGLRIGLLSNCFYDASNLLKATGEVLGGRLQGARITLYEHPNPSLLAPPELIGKVAAENDVAITALGHCGSCTSSAVRNAVNLARAGTPAVAMISEKFWEAAGFVARSVGMPDVPRVRLPHPVAGTGKVRIGEIAAGAAPDVMTAWKGAYVLAA
jgi:hypothetical protein